MLVILSVQLSGGLLREKSVDEIPQGLGRWKSTYSFELNGIISGRLDKEMMKALNEIWLLYS